MHLNMKSISYIGDNRYTNILINPPITIIHAVTTHLILGYQGSTMVRNSSELIASFP